jgi:hypothetical protein
MERLGMTLRLILRTVLRKAERRSVRSAGTLRMDGTSEGDTIWIVKAAKPEDARQIRRKARKKLWSLEREARLVGRGMYSGKTWSRNSVFDIGGVHDDNAEVLFGTRLRYKA